MEPDITQFTQKEQVLAMLRNGPVCGTRFLARRIPRYPARIFELKQDGHLISKRRCGDEQHRHASAQFEWFKVEAPQQVLRFGDGYADTAVHVVP